MFKNLLILLMMTASATLVKAQQVLYITAQTDQTVYITGEEIWVYGSITGSGETPKSIQVQLLDRKGIARVEASLLNNNGTFSGSMIVPADLLSDYYFLDGYARGYASSIEMRPVLVVNPRTPIMPCSSVLPMSETTVQQAQQIQLATDKSTYAKREKVDVSATGIPAGSAVSITVQRYDRLAAFADSIIRPFHLLVQHPAMGEKETEGNIIKARILSTMEGTPKKGIRVFAAIVGDQAKISSCVSDMDGRLRFILPFVYGETQVVFSAEGTAEQRYRIEMEEDNTNQGAINFPCLQINETLRPDIEERILSIRTQKGYFGDPLKQYVIGPADTTDFYGKPDHQYALDDYVRFPDMMEILLEFVPEVRVRNGETALPVVQILDEPYKTYFESAGMVMLDGIPIQDIKELLAFNPLLIKSIDVMSRKYYLGDITLNGVLHYKTYKGDLAGFTLPARDVIYPFSGIQIPASPVFKSYDTNRDNPLPDFRNLLYFEQNSRLSSEAKPVLSFYSSDATGAYKLVITGRDKAGNAIYGETKINIE